jgi:hypothetical protein
MPAYVTRIQVFSRGSTVHYARITSRSNVLPWSRFIIDSNNVSCFEFRTFALHVRRPWLVRNGVSLVQFGVESASKSNDTTYTQGHTFWTWKDRLLHSVFPLLVPAIFFVRGNTAFLDRPLYWLIQRTFARSLLKHLLVVCCAHPMDIDHPLL